MLEEISDFAAGCATPLPVVRLVPQDPNAIWIAGRAVTSRADGGIRAAAAFERQDGRAVGFRVELQNDSAATVTIDPREMQLVTCDTAAHCSPRQHVVDPEEMLVALDEARSRNEAQAKDSAAAGSVLLFLSVTADAASISRGHDHHAGERTALAGISLQTSESASKQRLADIESEKSVWSTSSMRRTTLLAGHGAAGLVYLPFDRNAQYVWLNVRAGENDFWFCFQQSVVTLPRNRSATN